MANRDPITIVTIAISQSAGRQSHCNGPSATRNTRNRTAKPAALVPAAMNPVTDVGAPWYTSGVQEWNGTTAILNANPTARSAAAANIKRESVEGAPDNPAMREMFVVPVAPNARATPYKRIALENAPRRKYFSDAS